MNRYLIDKLKEGRANKNYRQSDVTKLTGIKSTTLSNYENGVTEPDIDTFLKLCDLYDLDFAELLGEGYGYKVPGADFDIKRSEIDFIKRYRKLDDHGKEIVSFVLQKEYERYAASPSPDAPTSKDHTENRTPDVDAVLEEIKNKTSGKKAI